jgi:hypothetical protein
MQRVCSHGLMDRNPLGTTMIYKYKIDQVKDIVTRKCSLCLSGNLQKEGVDSFKHKFLTVRKIEYCTPWQQQPVGICSDQTSLRRLCMVSWMCSFIAIRILVLNVRKAVKTWV